jgi:hypothetical protein
MKQTLEGVLKYLRKNYCSYWIILGIDTAIAVLCTWIAYIGIYSMTGISVRTDVFAKIIGISFISSILGSYIFRTYRNTIRFSQLKELWRLMGSACLKAICMVIAIWIFIPQMGLSNSQRMIFVLFDGMLTFIAMAGFRIQLILIYDRNHITIEGRIESTFDEDVKARFEAYGWQVQEVASGENMDAIQAALDNAKADTEHPSLIIVNTEIGYGTAKQGKASAHGEPLGEEALKSMREFYQWDYAPFEVPGEVYAHFDELGRGYAKAEEEYDRMFEGYKAAYPELYAEWVRWHDSKLPEEFINDPRLTAAEKPMATRATSGEILNLAAEYMPNLFGGSADLAPSNKSELKGKPYYSKNDRDGSNVHFGIREFAMAAACNGIMLYGGCAPTAPPLWYSQITSSPQCAWRPS